MIRTRYFIHLAFDGSNYCGWQVQPNAVTVQGQLNFALSKLLNERVSSYGCGRTDTGVHARDFYLHFETEKPLDNNFVFRLNCVLPDDITVFSIREVAENAHSRFDARERTYEYYMHFEKNPFLRHYSFGHYFYALDWEKINEATALLPTFSDFTSLCRVSEDFKTNICQLTEAYWEDYIFPMAQGTSKGKKFTVTSNRFLRGMVRRIVGNMIMIGKGRISVADFKDTVESQRNFKMESPAPPQGLYLTKVVYPDGILNLDGKTILTNDSKQLKH